MPTTTFPVIRQIESLLQEKLIPWLQNGAPHVFFDTPPRGLMPLEIKGEKKPALKRVTPQRIYPHVQSWPSQNLNSIDVPVLGCIFEGKTDYQVRRPPGKAGMQWTIPLQAKSFFLIPPGIPFTRGFNNSEEKYARGVLIHLRRDGVKCFTFTRDHRKIWQNPYVLLHQFDAQLLGWRLLEEWRQPVLSSRIIYHYTSLILELMLRSIRQKQFTDVHGVASAIELPEIISPASQHSQVVIEHAKMYIIEHLENPDLSCNEIALNVGVSSRHLERLFKQETSFPTFQFVQQQRLEKAKVLLQGPGLSIEHVAYYCGFRQASHFSKWFAQQTQFSPREYRRQKDLMSGKDN